MPRSYRLDPLSPRVVFHLDSNLSIAERLAYLAMAQLADPETCTVQVSLWTLRAMTGMNEQTTRRVRRSLIEKQAIELVAENEGKHAAICRLTAGHLPTLEIGDNDSKTYVFPNISLLEWHRGAR